MEDCIILYTQVPTKPKKENKIHAKILKRCLEIQLKLYF
jgi:hypothetical protein